MLAVLIGDIGICVGLAVLILPLVFTELSRPRDSAWGALLMILGLVLSASKERFTGSPMIAVVLGSMIIARLGREVACFRWEQLDPDEQKKLLSLRRLKISFSQFLSAFEELIPFLLGLFKESEDNKKNEKLSKKWIRPDPLQENQSLKSNQISKNEIIVAPTKKVPDSIVSQAFKDVPSSDP